MDGRLLNRAREQLAGFNGELIHEDFIRAEALRQSLVKSSGVGFAVSTPIANKNLWIFGRN